MLLKSFTFSLSFLFVDILSEDGLDQSLHGLPEDVVHLENRIFPVNYVFYAFKKILSCLKYFLNQEK